MAATSSMSPTAIHQAALRTEIREVAQRLQSVLSRQLTAYATGIGEGKSITRWASGEVSRIRDTDVERRLRLAYEMCELLSEAGDSDQTIKAWFIAHDPFLGEAPVDALRDGRFGDVYDAALAFLANG